MTHIDPNELTGPGTVDDPQQERERAEEAAVREAESRARSQTKYAEDREAQEARRRELAQRIQGPLDEQAEDPGAG
jgi:hypothetical protein